MGDEKIIRIAPYHYIHVLDHSTNVSRVETGPKTYIRQDHERVLFDPVCMVTLAPGHYCVVVSPVLRDEDLKPLTDQFGQVRLRHGDQEVRLSQDPFPLFPGERLGQPATPLQVVKTNTALHLQAQLDYEDDTGDKRLAGDEWLFEGPGTYIPRKEVTVLETIEATIIRQNQAIRLRARKETKDRDGRDRVTGEEWLVRKVGAYLPGVYEEVLHIVDAYVLTEKRALHLRAVQTSGEGERQRKTGEEWLVTMAEAGAYVPGVQEEVVGVVDVTTLGARQYCLVLDPVGREGKNQLGQKLVVKGEKSFFLRPGERLEAGIQDTHILSAEEGLVLRAIEGFEEKDGEDTVIVRRPGDRWLIRGPRDYVPPVMVEVVAPRRAIPLDQNEGIYVRDITTGKVRSVIGQSYMLSQDEELWVKPLPPSVEGLLGPGKDPVLDRTVGVRKGGEPGGPDGPGGRDPTRVVTYRVPHNAAVQVYNYGKKTARVVFGPCLVMLDAEEQFTVLSLSGGRPKAPGGVTSLCLLLGPDFCTDLIVIETADHARLQLLLSYNWHFDVKNREDSREASRVFSVLDFIGDACKAIASRIRGAVASVQFDDFHKNSARIIRSSVFGLDADLRVREELVFPQNGLAVTSVDVQSVEPVDQRTRDALQRSVQLAIEITTNSQEATARHEAERLEQEAKGRLERQRIVDQAEAERARKELLELEAESAAVESRGAARAEAEAKGEAARIEGEGAVKQAKLKAQALDIETEAELSRLTRARDKELKYVAEQNRLELEKVEGLSQVEVRRFEGTVQAIGAETLRDIALAGPELQVKLLQGLGLKSTLITDGSTPVNLFATAKGMLGLPLSGGGRGWEE